MVPEPRLISLATAVPPHTVRQDDARALAAILFADVVADDSRLLDVFRNTAIEARHICKPLEWYRQPRSFEERNAVYLETALELGSQASTRALDSVGLTPQDVDHVVFVSTTGVATPSIDARLVTKMGL